MNGVLGSLGAVLVLGGLAHCFGVASFYLQEGIPDANRVLLDIWVAEAQIIGGAFYLAAWRACRRGTAWRGLAAAGAITVLAYALPFLPVLFARAPVMFLVPQAIYALLSVAILADTVMTRHTGAKDEASQTPSVRV